MELAKVVSTRMSVRGYKPEPVSKKTILEILEISKWSPSGSNIQPWEIAVVTGAPLDEIKKMVLSKRAAGIPQRSAELPPMYVQRRTKLIEDVTKYFGGPEAYQQHMKVRGNKGNSFYGAPAMILVYNDKTLPERYLFDIGLFIQTILLAAHDKGLGTCILGSTASFAEDIAGILKLPADKKIVYGIAIGYPDANAPENKYPRFREPIDGLTKWFGF